MVAKELWVKLLTNAFAERVSSWAYGQSPVNALRQAESVANAAGKPGDDWYSAAIAAIPNTDAFKTPKVSEWFKANAKS